MPNFGAVPKLSLFQRLKLYVSKECFVGYQRPDGYLAAVPVYAIKCKKHGVYMDTPHGFNRYFSCPKCDERRYQFAD